MLKQPGILLPLIFTVLLGGCFDDDEPTATAPSEPIPAERTYVVFSPATSELPIPNDLMFSAEPLADGTMRVDTSDDPDNPVLIGIDSLDGNSVTAPFDIKFSGPLDDAQNLDANSFAAVNGSVIPNPNQNVFLLPLSYPGGDGLLQAKVNNLSVEVPTFAEAAAYQSAVATGNTQLLATLATPKIRVELLSQDGDFNNVIRITPLEPLLPETKYLVLLTNISDWSGNSVYPSLAYQYIRDPESNLGDIGLDGLRPAIQGWEQLAAGYFGFKRAVYEAASLPLSVPTQDDVIFSLTFTTGGTDRILKSIAAPETFFERSLTTKYKQSAISSLVSGFYNVSGDNTGFDNATDVAINTTINILLTAPSINNTANPLYNSNIAAAVNAGASYTSIAADPTAAHIMQRAAAEAAFNVHNSGSAEQGDMAPYVDIATEAAGTVAALAQGASAPPSAIFPIPSARESSFYRRDLAGEINAALVAPALVYQGQIKLPIYQAMPTQNNGSAVVSSRWQADKDTLGYLLDIAQGNEMETTPPSSMVTYRYPFPTKQADVNVPLLATLPEPTTLANFGITKPAEGWPVVIFMHGITSDRSSSLPMANALSFACVRSDLSGPSGAPCFATVAIDQPLHGIDAAGATVPGMYSVSAPDTVFNPNMPGVPAEDLTERHYNYTADATNTPVLMDYTNGIGESGSLYINLSNFANSRDTLRQGVLDLLNLNASLATMDVDGDGEANDLDTSKVYFIGHSLGGIDGLTFVAINNLSSTQNSPFNNLPKIQAASAMFPGGSVTRLLTNSPTLAPRILQGLANASDELAQGRSGLESYLNVFQGLLDSTDPINFTPLLRREVSDTGVLFSEIIGNGTPNLPPDQVIPNAADSIWGAEYGPLLMILENGFAIDGFPAPLAGSEPLIAQLQATKTAEAEGSSDPAVLVSRYIEGSHTTPVVAGNTDIDPLTSGAVFSELLHQTVTFFSLNGVVPGSIVDNEAVLED
ncbi:hypothetical protein P886_2856 [Alteromonadaceae bacterium 2753L.S.0a.02]|nr:hypothetical protein P886_2856 [Alteromonadaceae bacterium 2753L.S.0a.02]